MNVTAAAAVGAPVASVKAFMTKSTAHVFPAEAPLTHNVVSSSQHDVSHAFSVVTAVAATPVFIFMFAVPALLLAAVQDTSAHVTVGMVSQQFAMLSTEVAPAAAASFEKMMRLPVPQKAGLAVYFALHVTGVAALQQASSAPDVYVAVATPFASPRSVQLHPAE